MRCWLSLCCLLAGAWAQADDAALLDSIARQLSRSPVVRAGVMQEKTLAILSRPMRSQGHLLFSRDHGLYWAMTSPIASETVMTREALLSITDGQRRLMTVAEQPALAAVGDIFFPVLSGDIAALQGAFMLHAEGNAQRWTLVLIPRNEPLSRFIARITLSGSTDLERMQLTDSKGDNTLMQFTDVQRTPVTLHANEQAHFDF